MKQYYRLDQRGFTLIEFLAVLVLIVIALGGLALILGGIPISEAISCRTQLDAIKLEKERYDDSKTTALCISLNKLIDKFNETCGERFSTLEPESCE